MIRRLANLCFRRHRMVLLLWVLVAVGATVGAGAMGERFSGGGALPGTDSQRAYDLFRAQFPSNSGQSVTVVFRDAQTLQAGRVGVDEYLRRVAALPGVESVSSPFDQSAQVSADGTIGYATIDFAAGSEAQHAAAADAIKAAVNSFGGDRLQVEFLGNYFVQGGGPSTEVFGLLAAMVILLVAFGSLVAMGLPIVTAVLGILTGLAGVTIWSHAISTPDFTVQVASMVGLGVGIDYALFIVTRYRLALERGHGQVAAIDEAFSTAGRAVLFAGCTVVISLLGMFLMDLPFLYGLALGTSTAVLIAVIAALTLLPALLGFAGRRLERSAARRQRRVPRNRETGWHRWSRFVQRNPKRFAFGGLAVLIVAAAPVFALRMATADAGNDPKTSTTRQAYDLVAAGFGPGANGPLLVVADTGDAAQLSRLGAAIAATPGVVEVFPAQPSASGQAAVITVIPSSAPQSEQTGQLVHELRASAIPSSGVIAYVGGATASDVDFAEKMSSRLPIFIGAVLLFSFLLLLAVFRSVLVPLKAVVMNLLSIGAAYGVMVMVFQWGWLGSLFGVETGAPIEPWAPMMLFAIVFGLSMDYEVFLLSSVKEEYDRSGDNSHAVVEGLASTARVITAAAAIMVCVFGTFVLGDQRSTKLIGLGLAVAVLIDATIVRMVLVPATMELLGKRNWWMPRWLDRVVPTISVEEQVAEALDDRQLAEVRS